MLQLPTTLVGGTSTSPGPIGMDPRGGRTARVVTQQPSSQGAVLTLFMPSVIASTVADYQSPCDLGFSVAASWHCGRRGTSLMLMHRGVSCGPLPSALSSAESCR